MTDAPHTIVWWMINCESTLPSLSCQYRKLLGRTLGLASLSANIFKHIWVVDYWCKLKGIVIHPIQQPTEWPLKPKRTQVKNQDQKHSFTFHPPLHHSAHGSICAIHHISHFWVHYISTTGTENSPISNSHKVCVTLIYIFNSNVCLFQSNTNRWWWWMKYRVDPTAADL